jgi:peptide/nickel transport system substrate-binding protein
MTRCLSLFVAVVLVSAACGQAPQTGASPAASGTAAGSAAPEPIGPISMRLLGNWTTLDIQGQAESSGSTIAYAVYDRLVARDADGKIIPYLATSWEASATKASFKLRNDAKCADGTAITPTVVANSFKRLFDPNTPSFNRPRIFGPGPYTVAADDAASTVTISVGSPFGDLLDAFAHYASSVICPAGLVDPAKLQDQMFGSGPYVMTESVRGDHVTLKRRDDWKWGPNNTTAAFLPEQITIKVITNDTTAANLLLTGGLDVARVDGPDITRLQTEKSLTVNESHGFQTFPMVFQHKEGHPTADERVREALMSVVDPNAWAQAAFQKSIVTASLATPDVRCADPSVSKYLPQQSTDRATQLLKDAGWTLQGGKLMKDGQQMTITIISSQTFYQRAAPEYLQSQFSKLGINAVVKDTDQPTFLTALRGANFGRRRRRRDRCAADDQLHHRFDERLAAAARWYRQQLRVHPGPAARRRDHEGDRIDRLRELERGVADPPVQASRAADRRSCLVHVHEGPDAQHDGPISGVLEHPQEEVAATTCLPGVRARQALRSRRRRSSPAAHLPRSDTPPDALSSSRSSADRSRDRWSGPVERAVRSDSGCGTGIRPVDAAGRATRRGVVPTSSPDQASGCSR